MPNTFPSFTAMALPDVPLIQEGDDLPQVILAALNAADLVLEAGDIVVIASKIVSKSEGRLAQLSEVEPSEEALRYAEITGKDPRLVELVLRESADVSRARRGVIVTEHRLGFVSANSGIDQSNIDHPEEQVLLLPLDPDSTAESIRKRLHSVSGHDVAVVITDTHGRPFRLGNTGVAIGVAGMQALTDLRGEQDLYGRELQITTQGYADMVACAAHLLSGEGNEGRPIVIIRNLAYPRGEGHASDLNRLREHDMYR